MYYNSRCIAKCFIAVRGLFQIPVYTATEIGVLLDYAKLNDVYMYLSLSTKSSSCTACVTL